MNKCSQCGKTEREQVKGCNVITCYRQFPPPIKVKNPVENSKIIYNDMGMSEQRKRTKDFNQITKNDKLFYLVLDIIFYLIILGFVFFIFY